MKRIDVILCFVALPIGTLSAYSTVRWTEVFEAAPAQVRLAKKELIGVGDLFELHCAVCDKVGRHAWETRVKPNFMRAITYATIVESGDLLPDWRDIVKWARAHQNEAHRLMEEAARDPHAP